MRRFSAWILRHRKHILITSTILSFFYFLWGVNSYKYSYIGDVWPFYTFAKDALLHNFPGNPFTFHGVYELNSVIASWYQSFFMFLFGTNNFAWRLSNIILIIPMSYFYYKWLRLTFDWKIAAIATILMQCSFYLCTFLKIGYINPQALALFIPSLYYAALASEKPTRRNGVILGCLLGFSFYIYVGPIFPLLIWPYFLPFIKRKEKRKLLPFFVALILSYGLFLSLILPSIHNPGNPQAKTVMHREFSDNEQVMTNIGNNLQVFYKDFNSIYTHFIPFPYLDIVTQGLALIGTIAVIGFINRKKYRELLLVYLSTVVVLGVTNPYVIPPTSRGMMLVIFGFVFAAIGLMLINNIKLFHRWIIFPILVIIVGLNVYMAHYAAFQKMGYTSMALIFKQVQEAALEKNKEVYLLLSDNIAVRNDLYMFMPVMQQAYGVEDVSIKVLSPTTATCASVANKQVYLFSYDMDAKNWMNRRSCPQKYTGTVLSTNIWYY